LADTRTLAPRSDWRAAIVDRQPGQHGSQGKPSLGADESVGLIVALATIALGPKRSDNPF
jgi:hypothetical protein